MKRAISSAQRNQRGTALVEFALIIWLLVLLLVGVVDFGLVIREHQIMQNAAREGARFSGMNKIDPLSPATTTNAIKGVVVDYLAQEGITIPASNVSVSQTQVIDFGGGETAIGSKITVTYSHPLLVANGWKFGPVTLGASAIFRNFYSE